MSISSLLGQSDGTLQVDNTDPTNPIVSSPYFTAVQRETEYLAALAARVPIDFIGFWLDASNVVLQPQGPTPPTLAPRGYFYANAANGLFRNDGTDANPWWQLLPSTVASGTPDGVLDGDVGDGYVQLTDDETDIQAAWINNSGTSVWTPVGVLTAFAGGEPVNGPSVSNIDDRMNYRHVSGGGVGYGAKIKVDPSGRPLLHFDGTSGAGMAMFEETDFMHEQGCSLFVVMNAANQGGSTDRPILCTRRQDVAGVGYSFEHYNANQGGALVTINNGVDLVCRAFTDFGDVPTEEMILLEAITDAQASTADKAALYLNGAPVGTVNDIDGIDPSSDTSYFTANLAATIDTTSTVIGLLGDIAEIICYRKRLSDADRIAVEEYLTAKWGL